MINKLPLTFLQSVVFLVTLRCFLLVCCSQHYGGNLEVPGLCPTMMFVEAVDEAVERHRRSTRRDASTQTEGMDVTVYLELL